MLAHIHADRRHGMTRRLALWALVGGAAVYSWIVAQTKPFTTGANVAVIVGFVGGACVAGISLRRGRAARESRRESAGRLTAWIVTVGALAAVELSSYFVGFAGGRTAYPTLSSLYDTASSSVAVKALVVFGWLAMGWGLFRPRPKPEGPDVR